MEAPHGGVGGGVEYACVHVDRGDRREAPGDAAQADLQGAYLLARAAAAQQPAGEGGVYGARGRVEDYVNVAAVVVLQDAVGREPLHGQVVAPPLRKARAGGCGAVAVAGEQGLHVPAAHDVVVVELIHQAADVGEDVPAVHKGLVVGCGGGDIERETLRAVVLRVYTVEGKACDDVDIGAQGVFGPGGVYL